MRILKVKLTGEAADVLEMTKKLEEKVGVENLYQMSGIFSGENDVHFRYIDVITDNSEIPCADKNPVRGPLIKLNFSKKGGRNG